MPDTVATLIADCQRMLAGVHRDQFNRLKTGMNNSQTTVALDFSETGVNDGSYLGIDDEIVYVWGPDTTENTWIVQRAMLGTTATTHDAGELVYVNARYPQAMIREEIGKEINSWKPRLFAVSTETVALTVSERAVDLSSLDHEVLHILEVLRNPVVGTIANSMPAVRYRYERGVNKLFLENATEGTTLTITYAHPFVTSSLADSTELVSGLLFTDDVRDIVPYGVAWRLVAAREIRRTETDAQGEPRDAAEVPPGHIIQTGRGLKVLRDERIKEAALLLQHRWGVKVQ